MFEVKLESLFNTEGLTQEVDHEVSFAEADINGEHPFHTPAKVTGKFQNVAQIVTLSAVVDADLYTVCDRCAADVVKHLSIPLEHTFVTALNNEENDEEYVVVPDMVLDLDELVSEDVFLNLPTKVLCKEDCKGICPQCGKNLNEGPCDWSSVTRQKRNNILEKQVS